eukprot:5430090-Amphidinium_carterae.1
MSNYQQIVFAHCPIKEFQRCLDNTGSVPFEEVKRIIEDDLGRRLYDVFSYVDPQPLAAASIAQVHPARCEHTRFPTTTFSEEKKHRRNRTQRNFP